MFLNWLFLAISVLLLGSSIYALVQSLRAQPPRKGRAVMEGVWAVLMALLVLWNLQALGFVRLFP